MTNATCFYNITGGCYRQDCLVKGAELTTTSPMKKYECLETCKNVSDCTQWSWKINATTFDGLCYLSKTSELQTECEETATSNGVITGHALDCPGKC
jgi:hypothetical protein